MLVIAVGLGLFVAGLVGWLRADAVHPAATRGLSVAHKRATAMIVGGPALLVLVFVMVGG